MLCASMSKTFMAQRQDIAATAQNIPGARETQ
jgi:hypothetical protein